VTWGEGNRRRRIQGLVRVAGKCLFVWSTCLGRVVYFRVFAFLRFDFVGER
jgi:hypothetical protein